MADTIQTEENDIPGKSKPKHAFSLTGQLDDETELLAKAIHTNGLIYIIYGFFDGASLATSTQKYLWDLMLTNAHTPAADAMSDWMLTPAGIVFTAIESLFIISFSTLANFFSDDDEDDIKRNIALFWPYVRDAMKSLKNSYKGLRSVIQVTNLLGGVDLNFLLLPFGLLLGILATLNRLWNRYMKEERKEMMKFNGKLIDKIKGYDIHFMSKLPDNLEDYKCSYILAGQKLYYINLKGQEDKLVITDSEKLLRGLKIKDCGLIRLSDDPQTMSPDKLEKLMQNHQAYVLFKSKLFYIRSSENLDSVASLTGCPRFKTQQVTLPADLDTHLLDDMFPVEFDELHEPSEDVLVKIQYLNGTPHLSAKEIKTFITKNGGHIPEGLTKKQWDAYRERIRKQDTLTRVLAVLSATYSGIIDSFYLYVGVLGLCALGTPVLAAMTGLCAIYSIGCVVTRVYEEHAYQRSLEATQAEVELELYVRENFLYMQTSFNRLLEISGELSLLADNKEYLEKEQSWLTKVLEEKINLFSEKRGVLDSLLALSHLEAFLAGAKNGLAAYGALCAGVFMLSAALALASVAFPPALLVTFITMGMVLLAGFIAHSMIYNLDDLDKRKKYKPDGELLQILELYQDVKNTQENSRSDEQVKQIIVDGVRVVPSLRLFFYEWFEVIRSFFSGLYKGIKVDDYFFIALMEKDEAGHYHDTPVMFVLAVISSTLFSCIMALRAFARGFGREPLSNEGFNGEWSNKGQRGVNVKVPGDVPKISGNKDTFFNKTSENTNTNDVSCELEGSCFVN